MLDTNTARCIRFMIHGMLCFELISCRSAGKVQPSCFWSRLFWRTEISSRCAWMRRSLFDVRGGTLILLLTRAAGAVMCYWKHALDDVIVEDETGSRVFFSPLEDRSGSVLVQRHLWKTQHSFALLKSLTRRGKSLKQRKKDTHGECLAWLDCSLVDLLGTIRRCSLQQSQSNVFDSREGTTSPLFLLTYDTAACRLSSSQSFSFLMYLTVCCLHLRGFTAWLFRTIVTAFQTSILCIGVSVSLYFTVLFLVYILCTY